MSRVSLPGHWSTRPTCRLDLPTPGVMLGGAVVVLFVYGTLMVPEIMRRVCGYGAPGKRAVLHDYRCRQMRGEIFPAIVPFPGERVDGVIYGGVTPEQISRLDAFEGEMYQRKAVVVMVDRASGNAQTYVLAPAFSTFLSESPWLLASFVSDGMKDFLQTSLDSGLRRRGMVANGGC